MKSLRFRCYTKTRITCFLYVCNSTLSNQQYIVTKDGTFQKPTIAAAVWSIFILCVIIDQQKLITKSSNTRGTNDYSNCFITHPDQKVEKLEAQEKLYFIRLMTESQQFMILALYSLLMFLLFFSVIAAHYLIWFF